MTGSMAKPRFSILLGGTLGATARLCAQTARTRVIAADSGMFHAANLGLTAELWVGDFDSAPASLQSQYGTTPREIYRADKDKTDGEIALDAALLRGARDVIFVGALGGQTDHAMGNLALMLALARRGVPCFASSGSEEAYPLLPGRLELDVPPGSRVSIIALADLGGLDITGVRWPLRQARVAAGSTQTLSNVATGRVGVGLASGEGLVFAYPTGG